MGKAWRLAVCASVWPLFGALAFSPLPNDQLKGRFFQKAIVSRWTGMGIGIDEVDRSFGRDKTTDVLFKPAWIHGFVETGDSFRAQKTFESYLQASARYIVAAFPYREGAAKSKAHSLSMETFDLAWAQSQIPYQRMVVPTGNQSISMLLFGKLSAAAPKPMVLVLAGLPSQKEEIAILARPFMSRMVEQGYLVGFMDTPGLWDSTSKLDENSDQQYLSAIRWIRTQHWVRPSRMGLFGVSLGGYWATRIAALDPTLRYSVGCGIPLKDTFSLGNVRSVPWFITRTMMHATRTSNLFQTQKVMQSFSDQAVPALKKIEMPYLSINGSKDSLVPMADTLLPRTLGANKRVRTFEGDDHCAVDHLGEMLDMTGTFILSLSTSN